ncbi:regulatory protein RecX [Roseibium algae]|uniref:Regulatory protein RecX n=1 Tax=Roseibium algae TaxID=3123038 RepID=A0ABU8TRU1_9HYPH
MFSDSKKPKQKPAGKRYKLPTEDRLTRSAVHYLQRYATSAENLRRVLNRKVMRAAQFHERSPSDFDEMIETVVTKCKRSGMVDDAKYAEIKVASQRRRGQSQRHIEAKLRAKGVPASVVVTAIEAQETSDFDAALVLARKRKIGPWRIKGLREDHRDKDLAILCRAGFSFDVARRIISGDIDDL